MFLNGVTSTAAYASSHVSPTHFTLHFQPNSFADALSIFRILAASWEPYIICNCNALNLFEFLIVYSTDIVSSKNRNPNRSE